MISREFRYSSKTSFSTKCLSFFVLNHYLNRINYKYIVFTISSSMFYQPKQDKLLDVYNWTEIWCVISSRVFTIFLADLIKKHSTVYDVKALKKTKQKTKTKNRNKKEKQKPAQFQSCHSLLSAEPVQVGARWLLNFLTQ